MNNGPFFFLKGKRTPKYWPRFLKHAMEAIQEDKQTCSPLLLCHLSLVIFSNVSPTVETEWTRIPGGSHAFIQTVESVRYNLSRNFPIRGDSQIL